MNKTLPITRRAALRTAAAASVLPLVHIRTAGAAGKLSAGFWDHWVPQGNEAMQKQVDAWAAKNKVEVNTDFITSTGSKLLITAAAEAQAGAGHDFLPLANWDVQAYASRLAPIDGHIKAMVAQYGAYSPVVEYLGKSGGHWMAMPSSTGTLNLNCTARISMLKKFAGIDVQALYPAHPADPSASAGWTYDAFLAAAEACHKAGYPFGLGLGLTADSINNTGVIFSAFGAELVNAKGEITVDSDSVRRVLEYGQKLVPFLPADTVSYDDASNNRALISGRSALILNPASAWAVAKRDAPKVAEDCWIFPTPAGPNGRFIPFNYTFWGVWEFSHNKTAAMDLIQFLQERKQVEERENVVSGYDIPPLPSMSDFQIWSEVEPPKGVVYNYPIRPWHNARPSIAAYPAPPEIAVQIYHRAVQPTMFAKLKGGQSIDQVIAWATDEIQGYMR
jgi:ABC-type glycerol-3-phosphate transport system substrate-binding protein